MRAARLFLAFVLLTGCSRQSTDSELRFSLRTEPKTLHPLQVEDEYSEQIRYLTGGVLFRMNRLEQTPVPELAESAVLSKDARAVTLNLIKGAKFSDGSPFDSADVLHTFRVLTSPEIQSAAGDAFRVGGQAPAVTASGPYQVTVQFAQPVPGVLRMLDQLPILSSRSPAGVKAVLGLYVIAEHKQGSYILLRRNPNYWRKPGPPIEVLRIGFQANRELEALAFRRGEIDLMSAVPAPVWEELHKAMPEQTIDMGPSLDQEFLWFNQVTRSKLPAHKKEWFRTTAFRKAVSLAINREDLCRIAWRGRAVPSAGPMPPTNKLFYNHALKPHPFDLAAAKAQLATAGFRLDRETLKDSNGTPVAFTILTNGGNRAREQMAALIQRDLRAIGIAVNIVTLDFPALLERISQTYEYDACLFGFVTADPDPGNQMNVWPSSAANHQWNPREPKPETEWEAEIDKLMEQQQTALSLAEKQAAFNRVQQIIYEQEPFIYLVHPNALAAVSPVVKGVRPSILRPQLLWNIESLRVERSK
jgi:peptide/nickel transport system substrate-binding protein